MRPYFVSSSLILVTSFATTVTALRALVHSPCAVQCGNVLGGTTGDDIVCEAADFSSAAGITFQNCTTCQLHSGYQDPDTKETDLQWALYNLRYAMSWCLFGDPGNQHALSTPCKTSTACEGMKGAIEFDSLSPDVDAYSYCSVFSNATDPTGPAVAKCNGCLVNENNVGMNYLNNFFTTLNAACIQMPDANSTISIEGNLFSTQQVNITDPKPPEGAFVANKGLSLGAKVGIAVGAILFALIVGGYCIIWNGKRRRRAVLRQKQRNSGFDEDWNKYHNFGGAEQHDGGVPGMVHATPSMSATRGGQQFFDSPDSQRPLAHSQPPWATHRLEEDSPAHGYGEKVYFSPYSSTYNSPISAHDHLPPIARDWPAVERKGSIQDTQAAGRDWTIDRKGSVQKDKKERVPEYEQSAIELQNVAPVLQHPGHGRPNSGELTEEDAKKGSGL